MLTIGAQLFRFAIAGLLVGASTSSAYAYLDPGTGSIILQVLLGGAAGVALVGKLYWQKFLSLFGMARPLEDSEFFSAEQNLNANERSRH